MMERYLMRPRIVNLWIDGSANNPRNPTERPRLEIYHPTERGAMPHAAVIVCPGGGYRFRSPHEAAPVAQYLAQHGLVGLVCHYRVAPARYPAPMEDVARAVRLTRAMAYELGIDPTRIALMGFSAGGHAAVTVASQYDGDADGEDDLAGYHSARPERLILAYPVVSMVIDVHEACMLNLFGRDPGVEVRAAVSAEHHVDAHTPPTFLFHTADDPMVPVSHSLRYAAACRAAGVPLDLHIFAHGPHGVGLAQEYATLAIWPELLLRWLADWLSADKRRNLP